ncbi:MAG: hypothetical protein Q4F65_13310 [Propionibacteriaceae bacterium]|nr:hypothetical protein [Propionibacteriaceae bacterium]
MNPPWWGIPVVLVIGAAVIVAGWWWDRRRHRAESAGFITAEDITRASGPVGLPEADARALLAQRGPTPTLPGGLADAAFVTHPTLGVGIVRDPLVLVTDAEIDDDRLLLPLLTLARTADTALVLVAPWFSPDAVGTLAANHRTGRVSVLPIELADPDLLAGIARQCARAGDGAVIGASDLQAGWLPDAVRGTAAWWIADLDDSWVETRHAASHNDEPSSSG